MYDLVCLVGRFQPFHNEHRRIIDEAMNMSKHVLVMIGSSGKARSLRNPFTFEERETMIRKAFSDDGKLIIKPIRDYPYSDSTWHKQVNNIVKETALDVANKFEAFRNHGMSDLKIAFIGVEKDHKTSFYLQWFKPDYDYVKLDVEANMSATEFREIYLRHGHTNPYGMNLLPESTQAFLRQFSLKEAYDNLANLQKYVDDYKASWQAAPYPAKHVTVDVCLEKAGHVLLVKRRDEPGKGLWALPGGHLDENERLRVGAIRELKEETGIDIPDDVLLEACSYVFDDPHRSDLGRVITHAFHIGLSGKELNPVPGADDAETAEWVSISKILEMGPEYFYDDHFEMIETMMMMSAWVGESEDV